MLNVWNRFSIIFSLICFHLFISTPGGARGKPQPRPPQHDQAQDQEEAAQEDPRAGQPDGDHHHQPTGWVDRLPGRGGRRLRGHGWGDAERQKQRGRGDRGRGLHCQARGRAEEWVVLWQTGGIRSIRGDVWVSSRISGLSSGNYSSINTGFFLFRGNRVTSSIPIVTTRKHYQRGCFGPDRLLETKSSPVGLFINTKKSTIDRFRFKTLSDEDCRVLNQAPSSFLFYTCEFMF